MAELVQYYGTGRRKSSIARVFLRPGSGEFSVNKKKFEEYFVTAQQRAAAKRSLGIADIGETFDVVTTVRGGGVMGQAEGLVTRDSRGKERKKYGQKGARARFQFSKR